MCLRERQGIADVGCAPSSHAKNRGGTAVSVFNADIGSGRFVSSNDPEWAMNSALVAPDRVHPNQAGYTAIANAFPMDVFYGDRDDDGSRSDDCHQER